jgi:hypothetical protein
VSSGKKTTSPSSGGGACPADGGSPSCPAEKAGSKIILTGTPEEKKRLEAILDEIRKTPSGRQLLTNIDNAKNTVELKSGEAKASGGGVTSFPGGMAKATDKTGTKAIVTLDKNLKDDSLYVYDKSGNKISDPVDVVATHELTHALNVANGTIDSDNPERQAIEGENQQRTERTPKLTERDPLNHGGGYN